MKRSMEDHARTSPKYARNAQKDTRQGLQEFANIFGPRCAMQTEDFDVEPLVWSNLRYCFRLPAKTFHCELTSNKPRLLVIHYQALFVYTPMTIGDHSDPAHFSPPQHFVFISFRESGPFSASLHSYFDLRQFFDAASAFVSSSCRFLFDYTQLLFK